MGVVRFFTEGISFVLPKPRKTSQWIKQVSLLEGQTILELNYIFCTDAILLELNREYLNHDTLTDIITFNHVEKPGEIEGDIFISLERVQENCIEFQTSFLEELHRVIIHGLLHLLGYQDKSPIEKNEMRKKENAYLSLRSF